MTTSPFEILPFRFLDAAGRALASAHMERQAVPAGQTLIRAGDATDQRLFLLLSGSVEALDAEHHRVSVIEAGHYFGERAALFDLPRMFDLRTVEPSEVAILQAKPFLELLRTQPAFAQGFGRILREKQGLFTAFDRFVAELRHGATRGHIVIPRLLHLYRPLAPALHREAATAVLDPGALSYALARLPRNITHTFALLLADDVPYLYSGADQLFEAIPSAARRRSAYEMLPGKSLVVLRDGWSDLVDLVTLICILAVEARKLRHRVGTPERLLELQRGSLAALQLEPELEATLAKLLPDLPAALGRLACHHEDWTISVLKSVDNYNSAHSERWTAQLAEATRALTGSDPRELPDEFEVHVISSNTHSVGNCLSSWLQERRDAILAWGAANRPELVALPWVNPGDRLVALLRDYLAAHPDEARAKAVQDDCDGVVELRETALTGIGVQLFDLGSLGVRDVDPELPPIDPTRRGLILNIDYAFGQQAEPIIANIIALFGQRIRSVNILGKAGGLEGRRGDVMVATSFIEQEHDELHVPQTQVDLDRLAARIPDRQVLRGPVLTVIGTVLQNQVLLNYYRRIWQCIGLEMEGSFYCRQILESQLLGTLPHDTDLRFLYYTSDLPLQAGHTLSGSMAVMEGIPPLYAITREILAEIFAASPRPKPYARVP